MELTKWLNIGDLMEMEYEGAYASTKVCDISGDSFIVDYMTIRGKPVHLEAGQRVTMIKKSHAGLFFFEAVYNERIKTPKNMFFMKFTAVGEPQKNQRRQSFRMPLRSSAEVLYIAPVLDEAILEMTKLVGPRSKDTGRPWVKTTLKDVSEDGLLLYLSEPFEVNSHIYVRFSIDGQELFANALVRRQAYSSIEQIRPDMIGVQMVSLHEAMHKIIRKFLINYQIKLRQKEIGVRGAPWDGAGV